MKALMAACAGVPASAVGAAGTSAASGDSSMVDLTGECSSDSDQDEAHESSSGVPAAAASSMWEQESILELTYNGLSVPEAVAALDHANGDVDRALQWAAQVAAVRRQRVCCWVLSGGWLLRLESRKAAVQVAACCLSSSAYYLAPIPRSRLITTCTRQCPPCRPVAGAPSPSWPGASSASPSAPRRCSGPWSKKPSQCWPSLHREGSGGCSSWPTVPLPVWLNLLALWPGAGVLMCTAFQD